MRKKKLCFGQLILFFAFLPIPRTVKMSLTKLVAVAPYSQQSPTWPPAGCQVIGHYDDTTGDPTQDSIVLYQAYCPEIAIPAAKHQDFVTENPKYSPTRMTWAKPNFLWMMYRSSWGTAKGQEHILMIRVRLSWFRQILLGTAVLASQQTAPRSAASIVQWDPDKLPDYTSIGARRAIQIGMRGDRAQEWSLGVRGPAILSIHDISEFVAQQKPLALVGKDFVMPVERLVPECVFPQLHCPSLLAPDEVRPTKKGKAPTGSTDADENDNETKSAERKEKEG
jgi:hypothetical protein